MSKPKKKMDEKEKVLLGLYTEEKQVLRPRLEAFEKTQILKCLKYLFEHGCNESVKSAYEIWVKAGKP